MKELKGILPSGSWPYYNSNRNESGTNSLWNGKGKPDCGFYNFGNSLLINIKGKGFISQLSILIGVITGYAVALGMGIVDTTIIKEASLFGYHPLACRNLTWVQ